MRRWVSLALNPSYELPHRPDDVKQAVFRATQMTTRWYDAARSERAEFR